MSNVPVETGLAPCAPGARSFGTTFGEIRMASTAAAAAITKPSTKRLMRNPAGVATWFPIPRFPWASALPSAVNSYCPYHSQGGSVMVWFWVLETEPRQFVAVAVETMLSPTFPEIEMSTNPWK